MKVSECWEEEISNVAMYILEQLPEEQRKRLYNKRLSFGGSYPLSENIYKKTSKDVIDQIIEEIKGFTEKSFKGSCGEMISLREVIISLLTNKTYRYRTHKEEPCIYRSFDFHRALHFSGLSDFHSKSIGIPPRYLFSDKGMCRIDEYEEILTRTLPHYNLDSEESVLSIINISEEISKYTRYSCFEEVLRTICNALNSKLFPVYEPVYLTPSTLIGVLKEKHSFIP